MKFNFKSALKPSLALITIISCLGTQASTRDVFVQLFEWSWIDIEHECEENLPKLGITGVQISPPNEHAVLDGRPWYERYQPVSYKIQSRSGDEKSFIRMIEECKKRGVYIYVDAVLNHTAWNPPHGHVWQGIAGSLYRAFQFPEFSTIHKFNRCRQNQGDDSIYNWGNRFEIQSCNLANLPDLNTSNPQVQKTLYNYLARLAELGVKGLRIDAAKHIPASELKVIVGDLFSPEHIYQEVIDMSTHEVIKSQEYFQIGKVNNFRYGRDLGHIFRSGNLAHLQNLGDSWGYTTSDKSVIFIDNHDTQRGHGPSEHVLNYNSTVLYEMATAFMLAWPYGQPILMSSYRFQNDKQGPPARDMNIKDPCLDRGWVCEHRSQLNAELIHLRRNYIQPFITGWWQGSQKQIAFSRDNKVFFVFNRDTYPIDSVKHLNLQVGQYRDFISGQVFTIMEPQQQINLNVKPDQVRVYIKQ